MIVVTKHAAKRFGALFAGASLPNLEALVQQSREAPKGVARLLARVVGVDRRRYVRVSVLAPDVGIVVVNRRKRARPNKAALVVVDVFDLATIATQTPTRKRAKRLRREKRRRHGRQASKQRTQTLFVVRQP